FIVVIQAVLFARKAWQDGPNLGVSKDLMKEGIRSSAITSIGPSIVVLTGMLSLLVTMGGPVAWMRLSLIGSVMFESIAAGIGTGAVGVELGANMPPQAFTMGLWTMILCSIGWVLFGTTFADKMEVVQEKLTGGSSAKLIALSSAAVIGIFCSMTSQHLVKMNKQCVAAVLGAAIMFVVQMMVKKLHIHWLREWALTLSMLGSMVITALLPA
ncbi:MAG: DUF5058 family protein, partial [Pyramidobacter sp.]|nr:DUF5058 family protein [Pyramidobacter sp.]